MKGCAAERERERERAKEKETEKEIVKGRVMSARELCGKLITYTPTLTHNSSHTHQH